MRVAVVTEREKAKPKNKNVEKTNKQWEPKKEMWKMRNIAQVQTMSSVGRDLPNVQRKKNILQQCAEANQ